LVKDILELEFVGCNERLKQLKHIFQDLAVY